MALPSFSLSTVSSEYDPQQLVWGVKASFRQYVRAIPDGRLLIDSSESDNWNEEFVFPSGLSSPDGMSFTGSVQFTGHMNMLSVRIRNPRITRHASGALTLDIMHPAYRDETAERLALASLTNDTVSRSANHVIWRAKAALLPVAVRTFDDVYAAGSELDPVAVVFSAK